MYSQRSYRYYDTPDGQDFFKKQYYLLKAGLVAGTTLVTLDLGSQRAIGYVPIIHRYLNLLLRPPIILMTGGAAIFIATNLRGVDDCRNHLIGTVAAAYVTNRMINKPYLVYSAMFPVGLVLFAFKHAKKYFKMMLTTDIGIDFNQDQTLFANYLSFRSKDADAYPHLKNWYTLKDAVSKGIVTGKEDAIAKGYMTHNYK